MLPSPCESQQRIYAQISSIHLSSFIVTPKGVLRLAMCNASATREGPEQAQEDTPPEKN